jgi:anaerobic selenocysteine-containing dehydrogenase
MLASVEDGRVTRVAGDPDDPVFGGYTCIKGRQLPEAHHGPQRLRSSRKRVAGGFVDIATADALDDIADRLRAIIDQHGPHAVAVYGGTYAFQNSAGVGAVASFMTGLGSRNIYTSVTLDQPAKVYTALQWQLGRRYAQLRRCRCGDVHRQ